MDFRSVSRIVAVSATAVLAGYQPASGPSALVLAQAPAGATRLEVAPGTRAIYRVKEQLAGINFPNDAVGITEAVKGAVVINADGTIDATQSRLVVDLRNMNTDQDRRDNYLRRNTLQTDKFPEAVFVPRKAVGLLWPPPTAPAPAPAPPGGQTAAPPAGQGGGAQPAAGAGGAQPPAGGQGRPAQAGGPPAGPRPGQPIGFQLVGDMTIRGVTKEVTWNVYAAFVGDTVKGKAITNFQFATFSLERPSVAVVMTVEDDIRLELDLNLKRSTT